MSHIVLDEELLQTFFAFYMRRDAVDMETLGKLFCKLQPFWVTLSQWSACNIPEGMQQIMLTMNAPWQVHRPSQKDWPPFAPPLLEEMVRASKLQLMVTKRPTTAVYKTLCVAGQSGEQLAFTATHKAKESRATTIAHLAALLGKAQHSISMHDAYLRQGDVKNFASLLTQVSDEVRINIYTGKPQSKDQQRLRNALCGCTKFSTESSRKRLKVCPYNTDALHDRYIKIDSSLEIVLSSGFEHLFAEHKDCTCVIRVL